MAASRAAKTSVPSLSAAAFPVEDRAAEAAAEGFRAEVAEGLLAAEAPAPPEAVPAAADCLAAAAEGFRAAEAPAPLEAVPAADCRAAEVTFLAAAAVSLAAAAVVSPAQGRPAATAGRPADRPL